MDEFEELAALPVKTLSPSSIAEFVTCRERWRRKYVENEWERAGAPALVGWAVHKAAEMSWKARMRGRKLDRHTVWADAWTATLHREDFWTPETPADAAALEARAWSLYEIWVKEQFVSAPLPLAIEKWHRRDVRGVPLVIVARVDVELPDEILETKTSGKSLTEPRAAWHVQGLIQMWLTGRPVQWVVVTDSPKKTGPRTIRTPAFRLEPTSGRMRAAELLIRETWAAISAELAVRDGPWLGALGTDECRWCSYKKRCAWWT